MLPRPDFSKLEKNCTQSQFHPNESSNKITEPTATTLLKCTPCNQVFAREIDLTVHKEEHIPCGFAGCAFEAHFKILLQHQTTVHMNLKGKSLSAGENEEDIEKWRAERRKRFPKCVKAQTEKEGTSNDQIEPVNNNECQERSAAADVPGCLGSNEHHLQTHACKVEEVEKLSQNDFSQSKQLQKFSPRKRGFIRTYGSSERQSNNKFCNKRRRNQHQHQQQQVQQQQQQRKQQQGGKKDQGEHQESNKEHQKEQGDGRWKSKATPDVKSSGNFGASSTTKATSASGFARRPTLFEKLMQSSSQLQSECEQRRQLQ